MISEQTLKYQVRSIQLLSLVNDISSGKLVSDPYFQRNLVWREIHKQSFIETILLGYPFPQIFMSKGRIDLEKRMSIASLVDGQQRCNAITDFISDVFTVNNKKFSELSDDEKSSFFKYEIAVIELDLDHKDPKVHDIFQRINRTSSSLTGIEKKASEYSSSEYMLVCQFMSNHLVINQKDLDSLLEVNDETDELRLNPNINDDFITWTKSVNTKSFSKLINSDYIFSRMDISRKVNLMYCLNLVTTFLKGIYNRNNEVWQAAEDYTIDFPMKTKIVELFNETAEIYLGFGFKKSSMWNQKANFFSLFSELLKAQHEVIDWNRLGEALRNYEPSKEYKEAAKEGVNNAKERTIRADAIAILIEQNKREVSRSGVGL